MTDFRLNRVFSTPLSSLLLRTPVTPNHITTLSLALGVAAGWFFSRGGYEPSLVGALLYQTAVILDNCDGDIAREKKLGSRFGAGYDIAADFVTDVSLYLGLAFGALRTGAQGPVVLFAGLCVLGAVMHLTLVVAEKLRGFGPAEHAAPHPEHQSRRDPFLIFFDCLREGDSSWFVVLFAVMGHAVWLFWAAGVYINVMWIAALAVNFRWLVKK